MASRYRGSPRQRAYHCAFGVVIAILLEACSFPEYTFARDGEHGSILCDNGKDDDGDGDVDCKDPGCMCSEDCSNGEDDDADGLTDCADPDCDCQEDCDNGRDDDGDGFVDCADVDDCECVEDCSNGEDDDGDGLVDCADVDDCACGEDCSNGRDDDGDGLVDCADPECECGDGDELCGNGTDDDGDGLIDCEDTASCVCADLLPAEGWTGPVAVYAGDTDSPPDSCDDVGVYTGVYREVHAEPEASPASCAACECGDLVGASCSLVARYYTGDQCSELGSDCFPGGGGGCGFEVFNGICNSIVLTYQGGSMPPPTLLNVTSEVSGGSCEVLERQEPQLPPVTREVETVTCARGIAFGPMDGCGVGLCAPRPPRGFEVCIYSPGDVDCPSSDYRKSVYYSSYEDGRGCAPCACGAAADTAVCDGEVVDFPGVSGCVGDVFTSFSPGEDSCAEVKEPRPPGSGQDDRRLRIRVEATGTCEPSGGGPLGTVEARDPTTYCCVD